MLTKQTFLKQLKKLVAFETLTDDKGENKKALEYVVSLVDKRVKIKLLENSGKWILLAGNKDLKIPDVGYVVHMDVVSADKKLFKMKVEGGKAYGRGVSDMKFSIPIGVALLNELIDSNLAFTILITTDEEVGGFDGVDYLVKKKLFLPKVLLVPDGGDNFIFIEKAKGVCQVMVEALGKSAHASRPWEGKNALESITKLTNLLLDRYGKNNKKETWKTTMNIGQIKGGESTNQVCDEAVVKFDFRYPETDSEERILSEVKKLAKSIDPKMKVKPTSSGMPTFTDASSSVVKLFLKSLNEVKGIRVKIGQAYGASDARHFSKFKTPVLMTKPVGGGVHCEDEWVSINSCMTYYQGLRRFLENLNRK